MNLEKVLYLSQKLTQNGSKDQYSKDQCVRHRTTEVLKYDSRKPNDLAHKSNDFVDTTSKTWSMNKIINKPNFIKMEKTKQNLCSVKDNIK